MKHKIINYYKIHKFRPHLIGEYICLYFANSNQVDVIVRVVESKKPLTLSQVAKYLTEFQQVGKTLKCSHYRLICTGGFNQKCYEEFEFTIALSDQFYLDLRENKHHIELYAHNDSTYRKLINNLQHQQRAAVTQATGTGKSLIISKLIADNQQRRFLVLTPSVYIIDEIKKHLPEKLSNVDFMTYAKLSFMTEKEIKAIEVQYIILDEFHRCGAQEWGIGVNKLIKYNKSAKIVGTSATPIRYMDKARNMADELFDGNVVQSLSLAKAMANGILKPPIYVTAIYDMESSFKKIESKIKKGESKNKAKRLREFKKLRENWNNGMGIPLVLKKHLQPNTKKILVFCKNINHLQRVRTSITKWFKTIYICKVNIYELHIELNSKAVFEEFESIKNNEIDILLTINMLSEGIHIKGIDAIIMLRDTVSPNIFFQQLGRCLTTQNRITPVVFDFVNNFDNLRLREFVQEYDREYKRVILPSEIEFADQSRFVVIDQMLELRELYEKIMGSFDLWDIQFAKLEQLYKIEGHSRVERCKNNRLYIWCAKQKDLHKKGKLRSERTEKLNSIEFIWDDLLEYDWNLRFKELKDYYVENGTTQISRTKSKLGVWCNSQRRKRVEGIISVEQIKMLDSISFDWSIKESQWNKMYEQLKMFFDENGHSIVPKSELSLYDWCRKQRKERKLNRINNEHIELLDKLNFRWIIPNDGWVKRYQEFKNYIIRNQTMEISHSEKSLGQWVTAQRRDFKNNKLSCSKIQMLNDLNFIWNAYEYCWNIKYCEMRDYLLSTNRDKPIVKDSIIYDWYKIQKRLYKQGKLEKWQIAKLKDINIDLTIIEN